MQSGKLRTQVGMRLAAPFPKGKASSTATPRVDRVASAGWIPLVLSTPVSLPSGWTPAADCSSASTQSAKPFASAHTPDLPAAKIHREIEEKSICGDVLPAALFWSTRRTAGVKRQRFRL